MDAETSPHQKLRSLPTTPGVYLLKDSGGQVIYVGKAQALRSRVRQYFQETAPSPRIAHLMSKIADFEVVACESVVEALLLETNLIKQHHPMYNIRMADDKAYPYLKITAEPYPKIVMTRRVLRDGAQYFGPYPYHEPKLVGRAIRQVRKLFRLRTCNIEITRDLPRPCLDYDMGLCSAPCVAWGAAPAQYADQVRQAALFLQGRQDSLAADLEDAMRKAAEELDFERAAALRDQIQAIEALAERQKAVSVGLEDRDVVAAAQDGDAAAVQMFVIRSGRLVGREQFLLQGSRGAPLDEVLGAFLSQYYQAAQSIPREVLLPMEVPDPEIVEAYLRERRGGAADVLVPQRGEKRRLVEMAEENARLYLAQERARLEGMTGQAVRELQRALGLENPPYRIECYDISNLQGGEAVASMVVFEGGAPKKSDYRRFQMRTTEAPNDVASIAETLRRRFEQARKEQERLDRDDRLKPKWSIVPDLIVIDGGRAQLGAARDVLFDYNQSIPVIGLAKQHELIVVPDLTDPIALPAESQALRLLQRLRDEAHRFANAYHQLLRGRRIVFSALDEIPGIGEKRKRELIRRFGSVRKVREASAEEIASIPGFGHKVADRILSHLRQRPEGAPRA